MNHIHSNRSYVHTVCPLCDQGITRIDAGRVYLNKKPRCINREKCATRIVEKSNEDYYKP